MQVYSQKGLDLQPPRSAERARLLFRRGQALRQLQEFEPAIESFQQAAADEPKDKKIQQALREAKRTVSIPAVAAKSTPKRKRMQLPSAQICRAHMFIPSRWICQSTYLRLFIVRDRACGNRGRLPNAEG